MEYPTQLDPMEWTDRMMTLDSQRRQAEFNHELCKHRSVNSPCRFTRAENMELTKQWAARIREFALKFDRELRTI